MWRGLRTLIILSTVVLLILPVSASSALPLIGAVKIAVVIVGAAWTGFNVAVVGARSAAFAQADDIWVSDPPDITRAAFEEGTFATTAAEWNAGHASSLSLAPAAAPSGNAITVTAETKWEGFIFSPEINIADMRRASEDGVLWGQGYAYGTLEGIVTEEYDLLNKDEETPRVAEIPFKYIISDVSLPYERQFDVVSFDLSLRAWKKDGEDTDPEESTWHEQILLASVSIDGTEFDNLHVEGEMTKDDLVQIYPTEQERSHVRLEEPIEREVALRVPFPDSAERIVIAFRFEARGAFQVGKR